MDGLMMRSQLTLPSILRRAEEVYGAREVVSRLPDRSLHRYTYAEMATRTRKLALALHDLGIQPGERVATFGWNHYRHLEAYFGIPLLGGVLHTLNIRLHPDDVAYIINHAGDRAVIVDEVLLPVFEPVLPKISGVQIIVAPSSRGGHGDVPADVMLSRGEASFTPSGTGTVLRFAQDDKPNMMDASAAAAAVPEGMLDYEQILAAADLSRFEQPVLDEQQAAAMCYTSGTTGRPKGVLYSHRALVLHSLTSGLPDVFNLGERDVVSPVVPMYHVNAWGLPFTSALLGAKLVFPGPFLDAASLLELFQAEGVTATGGVPTIWLGVLRYLDEHPGEFDLSCLRQMYVGGQAAPEALIRGFKERYGIEVIHAWGMTEMSPLGSAAHPPSGIEAEPDDVRYGYLAKQGRPTPLVEIRARGDEGFAPWDGETMGELEVRGPCVAAEYFGAPEAAQQFTDDGWFRTGDIVTIDPKGYIDVRDRAKDVIKSGGEWISSIALENALMAHPAVAEAAVVAASHPKWLERPIAVVVLKPGQQATEEELRAHLAPRFAKWWLPDKFIFAAEIPRTSTGKFLKAALREEYRGVLGGSLAP